MHLSRVAIATPDKLAVVFLPSGRKLSFGELDRSANQAANALRTLGARRGDCVVFCVENDPMLLALALGAQRIGLYYALVSTKAAASELAYILEDSQARWAVVSMNTEAAAHPRLWAHSQARVFSLGADAGSPLER